MTEGQRLAKLLTKAEMTRKIDRDAQRLAEQAKDIASLKGKVAHVGELWGEVNTENAALRQRVAELEAAQRWVPTGHMKTGMGHGVTLEFTPDGAVIVGVPGANAAVRLPDDVRLCRLAQVPTPPGADI